MRTTRVSRDRLENGTFGVLRWVVIGALLLITAFPFYYMVMLSSKDLGAVLDDPGAIWIGIGNLSLAAFHRVVVPVASGGEGFLGFMRNSAILAGGTVLLTLLISIPGSYAVARLQFFGRRQVSALFLAVYFFPGILLAVPLFVFFTKVGINGSLFAVLIVYVAQLVAVSIFMLRNYFVTIPVGLEEAAALDGCSRLGVLRWISLPLAVPAIVASGLFVFMSAWNEFLFALLFLVQQRDNWTVSLGLSQLEGNGIDTPTTVLMAAAVLTTLPIIIIFFAAERLLVEGLTAGAEKG